jgi:hypothetical protein
MLAFVLSVGLAWIFEHRAHPERDATFVALYALESLVCCLAVLLVRAAQDSPRRQLHTAVLAVALLITLLDPGHGATFSVHLPSFPQTDADHRG